MAETGAEGPRRLALEVRFDANPIEGRVYEDGRLERPFLGWLGLMSAIEAVRSTGAVPQREGDER